MTREEEIGSRLENAQVNASSYPVMVMDADIAYLLARNEELQREKEKMQAVVDAARKWAASRDMLDWRYNGLEVDAALQGLDAKEQDDD